MTESLPYLIAIDGGGTRCRFAMTAPMGRLEVRLGSANVFSDRAAAIRTLNAGLNNLMEQASLPNAALADIPIYAGLAGVTDAEVASDVARQLPSRIVKVEDDRKSATVGALGDRNGSLIGVGTGSFLARQVDSKICFVGGYGPMIGDQASGHWLGAQLLRRVLLAMDGIQPSSPLVQMISRRFGDDPMQIAAFSGAARPADIAALAPDIIDAAKAGDQIALPLVQEGADYIAAGMQALGFAGDEPICAVGGVAPHYSDYLPKDMRQALSEPEGSAIDGALRLVRRLADQTKLGVA